MLGDLVQAKDASTITTVEGTLEDSIVRPDGALVTPGAIDRAVGAELRAYQVAQNAADAVEVEIIGGNVAEVEARVRPLFEGMKVQARAVTAIGVEPNGKYRTTKRTNVGLSIESAFEGAVR